MNPVTVAPQPAPAPASAGSARLRSAPPWRSQALALATALYAVALALWVDGGREPGGWVLGATAIAVALYACRRRTRVARAAGWGLAMVVASVAARADSRGLDACGTVGVAAGVVCAAFAIARAPADGGLVRAPSFSPVPWVVALAVPWVAALAIAVLPAGALASLPLAWMPEGLPGWALFAAAATALVLFVMAERLRRRRRLELGVVERAMAIRAILGTALAIELVAAVLAGSPAHVSARVTLAVAAVGIVASASAGDAVRVARATRRLVVLAIVGGGVALLGAVAVSGAGLGAWEGTLATAAAALLVGAGVRAIEAPLRPSRGVWLDASARAQDAAASADPDEAIRGVLAALASPGGPAAPRTELWTFPPSRCLTVDAAGYLHEREADLPETLVPAASAEPDSTLRTEVLDSLVVRRPDLRPLAKWMSDGDALLITLVESGGETEGALVVPRASRANAEPLALEEVRALKAVADRLAAACRARAAHARMLARAHEATRRAEAAEEAADRLRHERDLDRGRDVLAATRLAGPAAVGVYAATSRMALEALERRTSVGAPIAVVAPSGVDPVPYLARAHLNGARRDAPMVLVDATSAREHDVARWTDSQASPLALADRGMLVLLDGAALPLEVQRLVAGALAQKRAPWERPDPLDVQLALTAAAPPDDLVEQARLDSTLASRLGDARSAPVALPRLRDRPEDLRAILTDRLAREGLRVWGRPVGIEPAAYARLIEYPFPGEDAELAAIVQRLVARCRGDVVCAADVEALRSAMSSALPGGAARERVASLGAVVPKDKPGRARRKDPSSA
jgi:hypothetical protein